MDWRRREWKLRQGGDIRLKGGGPSRFGGRGLAGGWSLSADGNNHEMDERVPARPCNFNSQSAAGGSEAGQSKPE